MDSNYDDRLWFYVKDNQRFGPIKESEIRKLLFQGFLDENTLVWSKGMEKWERASMQFVDVILKPPPIFGYQVVASEMSLNAKKLEVHYPTGRPWTRYFAKMIDIFIFSFILGLLFWPFIPNNLNSGGELGFSIFILFLWSIIEPLILVKFGNTPGKLLLKTKIKTVTGEKINFPIAYKRSMSLWIRGLGLGLPLVSLIALIDSYLQLKNKGFTTWDEKNNLITTHGKVGILRGTVAAVILIVIVLLNIASYSFQPNTVPKNLNEETTTSENEVREDNTQIDSSTSTNTPPISDIPTSTNTSTNESIYDEFGFPSSGYFSQEYSNSTSVPDLMGLRTIVTGIYMTNNSSEKEFGADVQYYGRPLVIVTMEIENIRTTTAESYVATDETQLYLNDGQVARIELITTGFTGIIPPSTKVSVDLYFFPNKNIDLNVVNSAKITWTDYESSTNQYYDTYCTLSF